MSELGTAGRRTLHQRGSLRRALLDTSVLTTDIIAATRRPNPSSFIAGAKAGTVRCLIPEHVWDEVPRVLADRHQEGGRFDLDLALELWRSQYAPVLYVVKAADLPMTPHAQILAARDASDVPMLLLAGVIAPVVIIGADSDLIDSGLAVRDWASLRSALGDVGVTEGRMADLEQKADSVVTLVVRGVARTIALPPKKLATVAAAGAATAGALYWWNKKRPRLPSQRQPLLPAVLVRVSTEVAALTERHTRGEDRWQQAELGTPGGTLLHRVARTLVGSRRPLTRTAIVERLGEAVPGNGHAGRMAAVRDVLVAHEMFVEDSPGRWQVGQLGHP
ncbi:PIN domain-containing protein [Kitasatospora sp. NPDC086009]|uniref:PIN domain-containing protein n=1 Tax=unclassified Kitasatospora TaxID=2633591 RepID=UPI0037C5F4E2